MHPCIYLDKNQCINDIYIRVPHCRREKGALEDIYHLNSDLICTVLAEKRDQYHYKNFIWRGKIQKKQHSKPESRSRDSNLIVV